MILALDTSTLCASVALTDGQEVVASHAAPSAPHEENLLRLIDTTLATANCKLRDLDAIAISEGPGSFTGLRIGFATAKALCFAESLPLRLVCSLEAFAFAHARESDSRIWAPILDARRGEIFAGFFRIENTTLSVLRRTDVYSPEALARVAKDVSKEGEITYVGKTPFPLFSPFEAHSGGNLAEAVGALAQRVEDADMLWAEPRYLRKTSAEVKFPNGNPGGPLHAKPALT